jgi:DNA mismatch repair protein MutS2
MTRSSRTACRRGEACLALTSPSPRRRYVKLESMTTPPKSLITLEYDKVIQRLTSHCHTAQGKDLARALTPSDNYREVLHRQRLTAEARKLLEMKPNISLGGVRDIGELVRQASLGHTLEPNELLDVEATLSVSRRTHDTIERLRVYVPFLAEISDRIEDFSDLTSAISSAINNRGEIVAHDRLTTRLNQILSSHRTAIQEPIVTLRDGRYVIPVKAELRAQLPGVIHSTSSSGATVFLEPLDTVDLGNKWRELLSEEQREILRILRHLSARVGAIATAIEMALNALTEIDLSVAKARYGESIGAVLIPHEGPDQPWLLQEPGAVLLINARHPLLTGQVIPINAWLGNADTSFLPLPPRAQDPFTILLITGPNTGGKTVALKTVGLLSLMAAAGLPIPADETSQIPVFDAVYADIGDEQSIEQSLSTFSSHVSNIISILKAATDRSLVLLDELAAGTDPAEGSALATALLSHLLDIGCLTIATTHHGELKAFAHVTDGITNGSVEFDPDTLSPTFRLHIGVPGQSNALSIARRLGMPESVVEQASGTLGPDRVAVESLISDLHKEREAAETAADEQRAAAREATTARDRVTKELQSLERNRDRLIERTQREMENELQQARSRIRNAIKEMERADRLNVFERAKAVEAAEEELAQVAETTKKIEKRRRRKRRGPLPPIEPGDRIYLRDVPTPGEAASEPDENGDLEVVLGSLRARINVKQIDNVAKHEPSTDIRDTAREHRPPVTPPSLPPEIDLRGMTVDEALLLVDQRLDEAARTGVHEMRIIHGKGTGTLRSAVREMLKKHALVHDHETAPRNAGGDGVTIVELAS